MKQRVCKGCRQIIENPMTSMQQVCSYKCYKLWKKTKSKTKEQKLRKQAGLDVDAQIRKNDALYQQVGIKLNPISIISGLPTAVIHHWVYKSHSNNTRYYLPNGIPLTVDEHGAIHGPGPEALINQILIKKGKDWVEDLEEKRKVIYKLTMPNLLEVEIELKRCLKDN